MRTVKKADLPTNEGLRGMAAVIYVAQALGAGATCGEWGDSLCAERPRAVAPE